MYKIFKFFPSKNKVATAIIVCKKSAIKLLGPTQILDQLNQRGPGITMNLALSVSLVIHFTKKIIYIIIPDLVQCFWEFALLMFEVCITNLI